MLVFSSVFLHNLPLFLIFVYYSVFCLYIGLVNPLTLILCLRTEAPFEGAQSYQQPSVEKKQQLLLPAVRVLGDNTATGNNTYILDNSCGEPGSNSPGA